jgi:hypothetical protein
MAVVVPSSASNGKKIRAIPASGDEWLNIRLLLQDIKIAVEDIQRRLYEVEKALP